MCSARCGRPCWPRRSPFKRGRYVFPTDMVIATDSTLRIVPMGRLLKLDGVHRHTNGVYQGTDLNFQFEGYGREYFVVRGKELAEQILDDLRDAQQRIADAVQRQDLNAIHALDVFFEARAKDYWNDPATAAQRAKTPEVATMGFGLSADGRLADRDASPNDTTLAKPVSPIVARAGTVSLAAMLLAPPFWFGRNFASDEAAFANARARNRTYAFNAYVWEGRPAPPGGHRPLAPGGGLRRGAGGRHGLRAARLRARAPEQRAGERGAAGHPPALRAGAAGVPEPGRHGRPGDARLHGGACSTGSRPTTRLRCACASSRRAPSRSPSSIRTSTSSARSRA
ncbi:MAG: hypothetical protein M5U28_20925 [Sandaracinaceae bacterium]|nr:hypothetical protein [Sandaracinaceae bacterium]